MKFACRNFGKEISFLEIFSKMNFFLLLSKNMAAKEGKTYCQKMLI